MSTLDRHTEILKLAEDILRNIELSEIPLSNICLKAARLARLSNDTEKIGGLAELSSACASTEAYLDAARLQLAAASDKPVSLSSANPNQFVLPPAGNTGERVGLRQGIENARGSLQKASTNVYTYALGIFFQKRFSGISQEIFESTKMIVDNKLKELIPESVKIFVSIYDNLKSDNVEDWSNAVHSFRKLLKELADRLFPPNPEGIKEIEREGKSIKVGEENYINRLVCYIQDKSGSDTYKAVIGANLEYTGERIDSISDAIQKGSHIDITSRYEAERFVIYTYLLIGDIISL
jgi:hypothetical protein